MSSRLPYCFNCRNQLSGNKTSSYAICKAFLQGVPSPYGMPTASYYPPECFEEPEISIRKHSRFTSIQENDYVYEGLPKWNSYLGNLYSAKAIQKYTLNRFFTAFFYYNPYDFIHKTETGESDLEAYFEDLINGTSRAVYPPMSLNDKWQEFLIDWQRMFPNQNDIEGLNQEQLKTWLFKQNQSIEAKNLWLCLFPETKDEKSIESLFFSFRRQDYVERLEKDNVEKFIQRLYEVPCPADFYLPQIPALQLYVLDILNSGYTVIIEHLEELDLQKKDIAILSENVGKLIKLSCLYLSHNQLTTLPESIQILQNLLYLDLSNNFFDTLPGFLSKLSKLERLDLYGNQLKTLPDSVCALLNLNRLDLYQNQLEVLPIEVGNLINLKSLGFNHNQLSVLPDSLANLQTLEGLYCTDNLLTTFTQALCKLKNLKYLYLSRNQLKEIPNEISQLKISVGLAYQAINWLPYPKVSVN